MLKHTATKIKQTGGSTLATLGATINGSKDQRHIQDLISAERAVYSSLQRLSHDIAKASDVTRAWSLDEGEDLADVLGGSSTILSLFSAALSEYADQERKVREIMKEVRQREDDFKELKKQRKLLGAKTSAAEKRLSRMEPDNKNFEQQSEALADLEKEVEEMDEQIMEEETELADFKRQAVKDWMSLKFGGMLDCTTKGQVIAEQGKLLITEIPDDKTQPGSPRKEYSSHENTQDIVSGVELSIAQISANATTSLARSRTKRHFRSRQARSLSFRVPNPWHNRGSTNKGVPHPSEQEEPIPRTSEPEKEQTDEFRMPGGVDEESLHAPPEGLPPKDPADAYPEAGPSGLAQNGSTEV